MARANSAVNIGVFLMRFHTVKCYMGPLPAWRNMYSNLAGLCPKRREMQLLVLNVVSGPWFKLCKECWCILTRFYTVKCRLNTMPARRNIYRRSPICAVFWFLGHRTIRGTALIGDWFSTKTLKLETSVFKVPFLWKCWYFSLSLMQYPWISSSFWFEWEEWFGWAIVHPFST